MPQKHCVGITFMNKNKNLFKFNPGVQYNLFFILAKFFAEKY